MIGREHICLDTKVIRVTQELDASQESTIKDLMHALEARFEAGFTVMLHSAVPCTAGSILQNIAKGMDPIKLEEGKMVAKGLFDNFKRLAKMVWNKG
eukprot:4277575-Amphidinium_carterae.1